MNRLSAALSCIRWDLEALNVKRVESYEDRVCVFYVPYPEACVLRAEMFTDNLRKPAEFN